MKPLDALRLQLRLEGKEIIRVNLLKQVEVVPDEEIPLMLIAQLADENLVAYFDEALPAEVHEELTEQVSDITFPNIESLSAVLRNRNIPCEVGHYKTYLFPEQHPAFEDEVVSCYSKDVPKVQAFGLDGFAESVFAMEQDGKIVSACVSTRENDFCGEAWVYTDESYRQRGFAQKVVSAWAASLLKAGKIPFYSHKIQNSASAHLAKRLGLQPVFEEIVISNGLNSPGDI
jgi:RimJ/RimL family protein N-acetyltransferase